MSWRENGIRCFAITRYKLIAGFRNYQSSQLFFGKREIVVNQLRKRGSLNLSPPMFDRDVYGCCKNLGRFRLVAVFGQDEMLTRDTLPCSVSVDASQAKVDIKNVKCELIMCTNVKTSRKCVDRKKVIQTLHLGPMKRGTTRMDSNSYAIDLQVHTQGHQATSTGYLIKNSFEVKVTAEVEACVCCSKMPYSKQTVNIYNSGSDVNRASVKQNFSSGSGWTPQTFEPYICQFTSQFRLPDNFENNLTRKDPNEADIPFR